jgi:hypothetical protein
LLGAVLQLRFALAEQLELDFGRSSSLLFELDLLLSFRRGASALRFACVRCFSQALFLGRVFPLPPLGQLLRRLFAREILVELLAARGQSAIVCLFFRAARQTVPRHRVGPRCG